MKKNYFLVFLSATAIACFAFTKLSNKTELSPSNGDPTEALDCLDTISFNSKVMPVIFNNCVSCHKDLSEYKEVASHAKHILKALKGDGASLMPKDAAPLNDSLIKQFECWINQGKLNN